MNIELIFTGVSRIICYGSVTDDLLRAGGWAS